MLIGLGFLLFLFFLVGRGIFSLRWSRDRPIAYWRVGTVSHGVAVVGGDGANDGEVSGVFSVTAGGGGGGV